MKKRPCLCEQGYVYLEDAIKDVLGIGNSNAFPGSLRVRFLNILAQSNRAREHEAWSYVENDENVTVRYEYISSLRERRCCVHLKDFRKWVAHCDASNIRGGCKSKLLQVEQNVIEILRRKGFDANGENAGDIDVGETSAQKEILVFARQLESSDNATDEEIRAAQSALRLPRLWADYHSGDSNPAILEARTNALASPYPDSNPTAADRLRDSAESDINLGRRTRRNNTRFGTRFGETRRQDSDRLRERLQPAADEMFRKNPTASKTHVATVLKNKLELAQTVRTLRGYISKGK